MQLQEIHEKNAIRITEAWKTYDGVNYVLRGISMKVREGSIYGLLGASGCGKSTLLNSIIGLVHLDSGQIELSVTAKRDIGFMPQSISLFEQLTIEELLTYFGVAYELSKENLKKRKELMFNLLELPNKNRFITEVSGGQKRRISLAIALLRDPQILILDEPTVGVDPILREKIWDFLRDWNKNNGKTIILTTHYIEEAKETHKIALMRDGRMLAEESPNRIMENFNTNYLEEAFLKLSQIQETEQVKSDPLILNCRVTSPISHSDEIFNFRRYLAELKKNIAFFVRNIPVVLYTVVLPSLCIAIFHYTCGLDPSNLKIIVVNNDIPTTNMEFCNHLNRTSNVTCDKKYLSCKYLNLLNKNTINLIPYSDLSEAIEVVKAGNAWAVLYFSSEFSNALSLRMDDALLTDEEVVNNSSVQVYMDNTNFIIAQTLTRDMRYAFLDLIKDVYQACDLNTDLAELPIKFKEPIYGSYSYDFRTFLGPATTTFISFTNPITYGVAIFIGEKNSGVTTRSLVCGINILEILMGHATLAICINIIQTLLVIISEYWILSYSFHQPYLASFLILSVGFCGITFTLLLSTVCGSLYAASYVLLAIVISGTFVGGMMWPAESIHPLGKILYWLLPTSLPTQAVRSLTLRGWGLEMPEVYLGFAICFIWTFVFILATYIFVKINKSKAFLTPYK